MTLQMDKEQIYTITLDGNGTVVRAIEQATAMKTIHFTSGNQLLDCAASYSPMGAFIDLQSGNAENLADMVPVLRARWSGCPIIVMTNDPGSPLVSQALVSGADDFICKPVNPAELRARFGVRRESAAGASTSRMLEFGDITLDVGGQTVKGGLGMENLSARETALVSCFIRSGGLVVPRAVLKRSVWGNVNVSDNALDRKIFEVRKALRKVSDGISLQSVYGIGLTLRMKSSQPGTTERTTQATQRPSRTSDQSLSSY